MPFSPSSVVVGGRDLGPIIPLLRVGNLPLLALLPLRWWDQPMIMMRPWLLSLWDDADWFRLVVPMRDFHADIVAVFAVNGMVVVVDAVAGVL